MVILGYKKRELTYFKPSEKKVLEKFSQRLHDCLGYNLISLKLFGSRVRGDASKESDIDIFIVLKERKPDICELIYDVLFEVDPYYKYKLSLMIFSHKEYKRNERFGSFFIENINRESISL